MFLMKHRMTMGLIVCAAAIVSQSVARAGTLDFKDWTNTSSGGNQLWSNTSSSGTVVGTSVCPGCWFAPTGTFGVANAIDPPGPISFTTEFNANGNVSGSSVNFVFSNNYGWGTGGELILGNIHNYFEYTLSAFDFLGVPIDVNTAWTYVTEYPDGTPGQLGYFSTSPTTRCAGGAASGVCMPGTTSSENFYVSDSTAQANSGQGGVLVLSGLVGVGRIQLTLASSDLALNGHGSDFILFNVGTPVASDAPEPASFILFGAGLAAFSYLKKRRHRA